MRTHNGMRPQDIYILLGIAAHQDEHWLMTDIARKLGISASEVSESLNRSQMAGLIDEKKRKINLNAFFEFLIYGLRYVFPAILGSVVRGVPTAFSTNPSNKILEGNDKIVWPYAKGISRGQSISPLFSSAVEASLKDPALYHLLALVDILRIGRARDKQMAQLELKKLLLDAK